MRSTTDALLSLESSICEAFTVINTMSQSFFYLEEAYDTTWRHVILLCLYEFGLRGRLSVFMQHF